MRSPAFPTSNEPISRSQPRARAPSIVSARSAASPRKAAASASAHRSSSPTLTTESVPNPTGTLAARNRPNGSFPCRCAALDRGQWATEAPALRSRVTSASSTCTQWMHNVRRCKTAKRANGYFQFGHTCGTLCRIGTEDLLIHDPTPTEVVERAHHRSRASRFSDARDAARPAIADAGHRRLVKRLRAGRVFQLANAADPFEKLRFGVLRTAAEMRELQVRVAIDEPGHQLRVGKMQRVGARGLRHAIVRADGRDPAVCVNKNGAVLAGRRRDGMNPASSDPKHLTP